MCGIAGRFDPGGLEPDATFCARADALLAHRGPDGSGHFADTLCELVHRRLALIDLSATGHQPLPNEDGSVLTVFNGEIYNHRELRSELAAKGHVFRGTADSEVLVHLWEERGAEMVDALRGMFAFAIYDLRKRRLFLARDRFGIKPLYYAFRGGELMFASEIKALFARKRLVPEIDRQAVYDYLGLSYMPEPLTGFRDILALPAGTSLEVSVAGRTPRTFFSVRSVPKRPLDLTEAADRAKTRLLASVGRQRVADVPVATLLSGGIDSSLVVAAYAKVVGTPPSTFNVRFPDASFDETKYALAVSSRYATPHVTVDAGAALTPETVSSLLLHFDQPFADTSLIPTYWVARAIRDSGIICVLSGDGGDEAFGGYARFWRANQLWAMRHSPGWIRDTVAEVAKRVAVRTQGRGRQLAKALRLTTQSLGDDSILLAGLSNHLNEEQKQRLVAQGVLNGFSPVYRHFAARGPRAARSLEELSSHMTENLFEVGLRGDMLRKVDMMSMRVGLEVRVPLLDEDVAALGLELPHRLKTNGFEGKLVLRKVASEWLPRSVARHKKQGFAIPLDVMIKDDLVAMFDDLLTTSSSRITAFLDLNTVRSWLLAFKASRRGESTGELSREALYTRIFILLSLELWLRKYGLSW